MKKTKKMLGCVLAIVLAVSMMLGVSGCGGSGDAGKNGDGDKQEEQEEKVVIAVAVNQWDAVNLQMKEYFDNYLSKDLNVEFVYSEANGDVESITKFVQNAWAAGAVAVMDMATQSVSDVEPIAAKCAELGMYFTTYYQDSIEILSQYPTSLACVASEYKELDSLFREEVKKVIDDGEEHSMIVIPLAAQYGNVQQTQASIGAVKAFADVYGFEMSDEDIKERVTSDTTNYIESDITKKDGVKIAVNAKLDAETLSNLLKTGEYDTVVISGNLYTRFQQPILEAEQAINKNIKVVTMTGINESTESSFTTEDPFGNASLDVAILTPATRGAATTAVILNAVYGGEDTVRVDGKPVEYTYPLWACHSAEEYKAMGLVDTAPEYYMFNVDELKNMIKKYNDKVDPDYIADYIEEYGSFESVSSRRDLK